MSQSLEQINCKLVEENKKLKKQVGVLNDLLHSELSPSSPDFVSLEQVPVLINAFLADNEQKMAQNTLSCYSQDLNYLYKYLMSINKPLTSDSVNDYIAHLADKFSAGNNNRKLSALHSFCKYLVDRNLLRADLVPNGVRKKLQSQPKRVSDRNLRIMLYAVHISLETAEPYTDDYYTALRDAAIIDLLSAGIRPTDIRMLQLGDVDALAGTLVLERGSKYERTIKLPKEIVAPTLRRYHSALPYHSDQNQWLFLSDNMVQISDDTLRNIVEKYARQARIETKITPTMIYNAASEKCKDLVVSRRIISR